MHRADARAKLAVTITYILVTALVPPAAWPAYTLLAALGLAAVILAELRARLVVGRVALALPFALAALPLLVTTPGVPLVPLPFGWSITGMGLARALSIAAKSALSVQASVVLTATTPMAQLLLALRALRVPKLIVATLGLMWRYLFVLVDEAQRLLRARVARSGVPAEHSGRRGGTVTWRARVTGGMAGNLILRSLERADRTYAAMMSRGYDGEVRSLSGPTLDRAQLTGAVVVCVVLGGLALVSLLLWG